ncbi:MAG TPA: type VI secretion system ATPase TssH, partial [candidate division WOR-3 bacterium]|nr:type VI secretion system ATPase TssH [candidate division WOR-3 bacterium]
NIGSEIITENLKNGSFDYEQVKKDVYQILQHRVKPEFLNRVDEIIVFKPLEFEEIKAIVELELNKVVKKVKEFGYEIDFTENLKDYLGHEGFDPMYGARPLRRAIQRLIENPLSRNIIAGKFQKGQKITADISEGKVVFK